MKALIQRVIRASVTIEGDDTVCEIGAGFLVLLGVGRDDERLQAKKLADKVVNLRVFSEGGKFSRSLLDVAGEALVVSQFTLYADTGRGRRPGFDGAAPPQAAKPLYEYFVDCLRGAGVKTATGEFGAMMKVELVNDGPVTIMLETK